MRTARVATLLVATAFAVLLPASTAAAGGGGCHRPGMTDEATTEVSMRQACFGPTVARVGVGDTVRFTNDDPMGHMVTGAGGVFGDHTEIRPGGAVEHTFDQAGVFPYYCVLHPSMVGAVVVEGASTAGAAAGSSSGDVTAAAAGAVAALTALGVVAARRRWTRTIEPSPGA